MLAFLQQAENNLGGFLGICTSELEFVPGFIRDTPPSLPSLPSPPPSPQRQQQQQQQQQPPPASSHHSRTCSGGGVQLRIKNRRSDPASRPHSWHSTKLAEAQRGTDQEEMDAMSSVWQHNYHTSASTTNLSGGFDSGGSYLRKSPDQYSSRGSMESLDPPHSSQLHSGAQHHHPLGHHAHSGPHPAYSSCHQLSSARSSNSIDHLHSKRDSAYSSFSTSSSIPEYLASTPSFSPERSYSLETVPQREGGGGEMQQADIHYIQAVYDNQQGLSQEHELSSSSAAMLRNQDSRGTRPGLNRDLQGSLVGVCYRGTSSSSSSSSGSSSGGVPASNRHSVGPIWSPAASGSSYESLKGAPAPPRRSDSYAAIRNHERPNSWSSLDNARSLRSLQKGSWHHSSGPVASGAAKGSYGMEGQLHTVIEKSPESSPTTKPRQGGGFPQPPSPPESSSGSVGPAPQSGRLILPTVMYPVPQPEPHYAQMPSSNPGPGSSAVYPALAKESSRQQGTGGRDEGVTERQKDGKISTTENGHQNNIPSSSPYPESFYPSSQLRTEAHDADRPQQTDSTVGQYSTYLKAPGGRSEGPPGAQRPQNHQEPFSQSYHGSYSHKGQGPHSHVFQEQNQGFHIPHNQPTPPRPSSSQEWRDPYPPVQSRGDQSRSVDQTSIHSDSEAFSRSSQGQVPPTHSPVHSQHQAPPTSAPQTSPRHLSDSAALQYQHWDHREREKDREHPLTRLEIALVEVQRCASSDSVVSASSHGSSSFEDGSHGPTRSLSVLEKVSRFERRERAGKQRSHSTNNSQSKANHQRMTEKGRSSPCGADDLRHMLERSTNGTKAHRTLSYRGTSNDLMKYRTTADPSSALQRSRSSFQLEDSREMDGNKDFTWRQDVQEVLGTMQDTPLNRSYRDSLKDAQSKVLRSTSFRRRDLSSSISPPPAAPCPAFSSSSHQPPAVPAKYHSLEKKGPKTMPKPHGIIITPQSPPPVTSPHTPKERHVVSPELRGQSPPTLPSVPPVGPPALTRICGRKRLMAEQKKRSYSEPENLNEVGVSDIETAALFRRGGETSVADRRRIFELAASRVGGGASQNAAPRPDLRQLQHDALTEYVERKRSVRRGEGGQRRPRSAFIQPDNNSHMVSYSYSETQSLSSASSLLSLQDSGPEQSHSGERRICSTVLPGTDLRNHQSNLFYPGRVTSPRPPAHPPHRAPPDSPPEPQGKILQDLSAEAGLSRHSQSLSRDPGPGHQQPDAEAQLSLGLSKQLNGALERAGSNRSPGRSVSAEDLLGQSERQPTNFLSSASVERVNKDVPAADGRMFISERCALPADRPADVHASEGLTCPQPSQDRLNAPPPAAPSQDPGSSSSYTPVTRRERQRNTERQRAHSTSTLAASVGLPCPFFSPEPQDGGGTEWQPNESLSLVNLDAIAYPGIPPTSTSAVGAVTNTTGLDETLVTDGQTRRRLSDASILEDSEQDIHRGRAHSLEMGEGHSSENTKHLLPVMPTPLSQLSAPPNKKDSENNLLSPSPTFYPSMRHLSSLRISESSLLSPYEQPHPLESSRGRSQDDYDEVFLQNPPPPSPPPPIRETSIVEDFPPPPPPVDLEQETELQSVGRLSPPPPPPMPPSSAVLPPPVLSTVTPINTYTTTQDSLSLEYQPLPERQKTPEEQRVEALAQKLVLLDSSLAPLLDTWGAKSTVEIMKEIFPNSRTADKSHWLHRGSRQMDDRIQDGIFGSAPRAVMDGDTETEEDDKDVNTRKVELCEALRSSVDALRQEKEALSEEQKHHQELGASVEALVQERLKTNERDKYSMFIGDLEKIVNLLLSLCSRLSRIDRSLVALQREELTQEETAEERDSLHHKRSLLLRQTEDAWELKENLDRRQRVVHAILSGYLTEPQLQDYRLFVSTKPSLLIRRRHLEDLIRQEEEQLTRLAESLPVDVAQARGWSRASPFLLQGPTTCSSLFPPLLPGPAHSVRPTTVTSL
ncbi:protein Shroom3 isoform X2 [Paralichthys olivaceus]|uniref:protein Shroom3 isoform X2 n=1 Tax=Paralichthys olivaceus TaxID=8255 RepID=UPI003750AEEA